MSGYVDAGYSLVGVVLAGYSLRVVLRSRALASELPAQPNRDAEAMSAEAISAEAMPADERQVSS